MSLDCIACRGTKIFSEIRYKNIDNNTSSICYKLQVKLKNAMRINFQ